MGQVYDHGIGVGQDSAKAAEWYKRAAEQSHTGAQFNIAMMYIAGKGVQQNFVNARKWFIVSGARGAEKAKKAAEYIRRYLTPEQVAESDRSAQEWLEKHSE